MLERAGQYPRTAAVVARDFMFIPVTFYLSGGLFEVRHGPEVAAD
jgi:hypothetical protein